MTTGAVMMHRSSGVTVLGLDPGFASVGWAVLRHCPLQNPECIGAGVFRSARDASLRKNVDTLKRITRMADFLEALVADFDPNLIGSEAMSWTRFANADRAVAFFWGVIGAKAGELPIVQTTPADLKLLITGKKSASKEEVERHACARIDHLDEALHGIKAKTQRNHAADAAAAAFAALRSDIGKLAVAMAGT